MKNELDELLDILPLLDSSDTESVNLGISCLTESEVYKKYQDRIVYFPEYYSEEKLTSEISTLDAEPISTSYKKVVETQMNLLTKLDNREVMPSFYDFTQLEKQFIIQKLSQIILKLADQYIKDRLNRFKI